MLMLLVDTVKKVAELTWTHEAGDSPPQDRSDPADASYLITTGPLRHWGPMWPSHTHSHSLSHSHTDTFLHLTLHSGRAHSRWVCVTHWTGSPAGVRGLSSEGSPGSLPAGTGLADWIVGFKMRDVNFIFICCRFTHKLLKWVKCVFC